MESGKHLRKQCPVCDATVHAKRKFCKCGHVFPSIIGVYELDNYRSCLLCHARVELQTPPHGKCTRPDCCMIQLYDLCQQQISTRVMLRHLNNEGKHSNIMCSAYGDFVYHLANLPKDHTITKADLLKPQIFPQIQLLTGRNTINVKHHKRRPETPDFSSSST